MAQFMAPEDHFKALLSSSLSTDDQALFSTMLNSRPEASFRGRSFVVYKMVDRAPEILDQLRIEDYQCNDENGASFEISSRAHKDFRVVTYEPTRLWDYPLFMWLPVHGKLRWSTTESSPRGGTLAFDIFIRTQSRVHLRERGVVYCEAGTSYAKEFEGLVQS